MVGTCYFKQTCFGLLKRIFTVKKNLLPTSSSKRNTRPAFWEVQESVYAVKIFGKSIELFCAILRSKSNGNAISTDTCSTNKLYVIVVCIHNI